MTLEKERTGPRQETGPTTHPAASVPTLFDLPEPPRPVKCCHYCGEPLSELDALLPATCERSLICVDCCRPCHHAALTRMMAVAEATGNMDHFPSLGRRGRRRDGR